MTLASRLAARGLSADYKPIRGAEAFMAGELDDAHLLAEHRAACDELRAENDRLRSVIASASFALDGYEGNGALARRIGAHLGEALSEGVRHG